MSHIDLLKSDTGIIDCDRLEQIRTERAEWVHTRHWSGIHSQINEIATLSSILLPGRNPEIQISQDVVSIGSAEDIGDEDFQRLESVALQLKPWRKGPFQLFGLEIDTEWQSHWKWNRISKALGNLQGKSVLDVGCGNGYYMLRAAGQEAARVIGFDPSVSFFLQFQLLQKYLQLPQVQFELLGAEHVGFFKEAFDVVLCMGILYHQRNPISILRDLRKATRSGGYCILESQVIPGDESVALFPEDRYAKARNVFFVPTVRCLENWITRAGFQELELLSVEKTTTEEQRKTRWSTFESLDDFLDPDDNSKTVEGYPAPMRAAIKAFR